MSNISFTQEDKLKALAIVNIFETSKPFGDPAACVVLNDGAGISYGVAQFTHRSGSLLAVAESYLAANGNVGAKAIADRLPLLRLQTPAAIRRLSLDSQFKNALRAAAATAEMREAQWNVAAERYLLPAIEECRRRGFVLPLTLAVVYDSIVHGSWDRIAARTPQGKAADAAAERSWIVSYVRRRHLWLTNIPRLKVTTYRTKFFLNQIAIGNWSLRLPITVHGVRLTDAMLPRPGVELTAAAQAPRPAATSTISGSADLESGQSGITTAFASAAEKFDHVEGIVNAAVRRTDAAKSLWTTVAGTAWQAVWGVFGFAAGLPREIWIVVAITAAALMIFYLYRQIEMGKIRETRNL